MEVGLRIRERERAGVNVGDSFENLCMKQRNAAEAVGELGVEG